MNFALKKILSKNVPSGLLKQSYRIHTPKGIVMDQLQLIYVPIPKVANHSIKEALAQQLGMKGRLSAHKYEWNRISLHEVASGSYHSFGFVRNPFDRLVSCYVQKIEMNDVKKNFWKYGNQVRQEMSFHEFADFVCKTPDSVSDRHFKSQHHFLVQNGRVIVDFLGRFETLQEDWSQLSNQFNLKALKHINQSNRADLATYYTKELVEKVAIRYQKDIEFFHYHSQLDALLNAVP